MKKQPLIEEQFDNVSPHIVKYKEYVILLDGAHVQLWDQVYFGNIY